MKIKPRAPICLFFALFFLLCLASCTNSNTAKYSAPEIDNPTIRISTTTSVNDSGLLPYLQPHFEEASGYKLAVTSAGTGAAIEKAKTGDADMILVHAKSSEEEFIAEGFSNERIPFMYNFFIIAGPVCDPAGVKDRETASEAFTKIADGEYMFISRGDESGTHKAELKIWDAAGITPDASSHAWYISAGAGMGACITMADEKQAYVLSDKATFITVGSSLEILLEQSEDMKNTYSMLLVNSEKWPDTNTAGAQAFIDWMLSNEARELINAYGVEEYGQQLFFTIDE